MEFADCRVELGHAYTPLLLITFKTVKVDLSSVANLVMRELWSAGIVRYHTNHHGIAGQPAFHQSPINR